MFSYGNQIGDSYISLTVEFEMSSNLNKRHVLEQREMYLKICNGELEEWWFGWSV